MVTATAVTNESGHTHHFSGKVSTAGHGSHPKWDGRPTISQYKLCVLGDLFGGKMENLAAHLFDEGFGLRTRVHYTTIKQRKFIRTLDGFVYQQIKQKIYKAKFS